MVAMINVAPRAACANRPSANCSRRGRIKIGERFDREEYVKAALAMARATSGDAPPSSLATGRQGARSKALAARPPRHLHPLLFQRLSKAAVLPWVKVAVEAGRSGNAAPGGIEPIRAAKAAWPRPAGCPATATNRTGTGTSSRHHQPRSPPCPGR